MRTSEAKYALSSALRAFGLASVVIASLLGCHRKQEDARVAHGRELYGRMCAVCHGANGEGYKADQAPRLAQEGLLSSASDAYLRATITYGRLGTTMSAWGKERSGPLSPEDVNALIKFLRTWQKGPQATLDESFLRGDVGLGDAVYQRECVSCHGARGTTGTAPRIGNADFLTSASNGFLRHAIRNGRPGTQMAAYAAKLRAEEIDSVILLLREWQAPPPPPPPPPPPTPPLPLGDVVIHPKGPEPKGFKPHPQTTPVDVVKAELDRGAKLAILDARSPSDFVNEHIEGAVSVPFYDPSPYIDKLPKNVWLVCYCSCPHAESGQLAQKLASAGFKKVTVLDEGLNVWKNRHYPTAKGESPR
jgi:cytochrome c oxidase cbb3-type subunit 3/ubiquinol-cytochrome c reductase cytochrome c subunit